MARWIVSLTSLLAVAVASAEQAAVSPLSSTFASTFVSTPAPTLTPASIAIIFIGIAGAVRVKQSR